eukprot:CAMPEP_0197587442 /NCGR_PEP_ID=MMETSP1326-20131121/9072_1 /TAXON_ID=1155430 /ORGANISM="Genus nov. species nov., Strain RCC2288" /LENGTH=160 /DNA_ID=CAMNT_0043152179 /DNA_START=77 /DNA_END=559 /DNA_ORIENTATION=-
MNGVSYGANLDALLVSQASDGIAVLPGMGYRGRGGVGHGYTEGAVDEAKEGDGMVVEGEGKGCDCLRKADASTIEPEAKSASELMGAFGEGGFGQLVEPKLSLEEAMKRIDALQRSRTHLSKEKANLEGERNALNKVVKETENRVTQCQKEIKRLKIQKI